MYARNKMAKFYPVTKSLFSNLLIYVQNKKAKSFLIKSCDT